MKLRHLLLGRKAMNKPRLHEFSGTSVVSGSLQPHGLRPTRLLCPGDSPDKNTVTGCHALLQGIFLTQGLNPYLLSVLHYKQILYCSPPGKPMTNLDNILKSRDITLLTKVCRVKTMVFPVVMYRCVSWIIKKAECQRIDAFELWC